jgi:acyl-CoA reductase-like NAD-dependent aldehyde dehydrogenase
MNALHWINGEWLGSENGLGHNLNPADQSVVGHYAKGSAALAQ